MRTLSIRQPWAWLIVNGHKPVENREWSTTYRGPLLIHAGKTLTRKYYEQVATALAEQLGAAAPTLPPFEALQLGGVVGQAELVDCVTDHSSAYFTGPFGFVMTNPEPLPFVPWKGQLNFFDVPRRFITETTSA
jgi:hypothetical protein